MILVEKDYKSLQDEVEEQRELMKVLRKKYREAVNEIKDLSDENFKEKEYLLESIRELERENDLYK